MKPKVAVILSGYGVVPRGAESMLGEILPKLAEDFDLHVYSRSGQGPGGIARPAIPRSLLEPLYLRTKLGRKIFDTLYLDPLHVEWASHLLASLPSLIRGGYQVIWHETGLWGGFLLGALRRLTGVKLLDYAHSSHPGWELPFARRRPDIFVTADPDLARRVREEVTGLRVEIVPQGVDCDRFQPGLEPWELTVDRPVALFVGALSPEKRPDLAIEAAALAGFSAVVAGTGPLAGEIDALAHESLGSTRYARLDVERADIARLYNAADVIILPSPLESGALAVLESMACGTPVVTANDAVRRELVGEAGVLVAEQTPTAYAEGLLRARDTEWGDRPRDRAVSYSLTRQAQRFGDLLAELTAEQRP
jgi:glycosyltransferase involved in cell wall biosynthesis